MTIYSYVCPECGSLKDLTMTIEQYEELSSLPAPQVICTATEECDGMRRLFSPPGISIK